MHRTGSQFWLVVAFLAAILILSHTAAAASECNAEGDGGGACPAKKRIPNEPPMANPADRDGILPPEIEERFRDQEREDEARLAEERAKPAPNDRRNEGFMAHYVMMSKITYLSRSEAEDALGRLKHGKIQFLSEAERQQRKLDETGHGKKDKSGDLGMITWDDVEPEVAEVAFDIRNPVVEKPTDIYGPTCTNRACYLFCVFLRYRRHFFSRAWYDAETFSKENGFDFSQLLSRLASNEGIKELAFMVWPDEHISFKKIFIQMLKNDIRRIGKIDPSTVMGFSGGNGGRKTDMAAHDRLMKIRMAVFETVSPTIMAEHPEIYAMALDQIVEEGWTTQKNVDDATRSIDNIEAEQAEPRPKVLEDAPKPVEDADEVDADIIAAIESDETVVLPDGGAGSSANAEVVEEADNDEF